jgi:RNA polymerase sigma-70 factor (ECF subfamily)
MATDAMTEQTEAQIVQAAQNGHLASFAALYERYHSAMVAVAYTVLRDVHLAEDAAQEVFAIACQDLAALRHTDKFGAWLAGICRNVATSTLRSQGKATAIDVQEHAENQDDRQQRADAIRRAVWRLRPSEREVIVLRYYDNLPYEKMSSVLGISTQAVNGRLIRARRKIAKYLRYDGFTGEDHETG